MSEPQVIEEMIQVAIKTPRPDICETADAIPAIADLEEPPLPVRQSGSKKYTEAPQRRRLAGTVPLNLFEAFDAGRKKRGKNISQMLEFVLHNFYRDHPEEG
jgi:hypothetical protein